jgi:sec-independent protein translocase protein TatB
MLGVGWTEMLVIGVVALIVIGPKDLPIMMRRVGQFAGMIRRMGTEFQREINRSTGLDEIKNLRTSITAPLKKTTDEIRREFNAMTPTGVKPSGVIKPADPKAESVVDEIKAAAGMTPASTTAAVAAPKQATAVAPKAPVKASRTLKPVKVDTLEPPKKATAKRVVAKSEAAASPAPIEAIAPVRKATARKAVKVDAEAKPKAAPKPRTRKPDQKTAAAE